MSLRVASDQNPEMLSREAGLELFKPAANDLLQHWPVSRRVNRSRAPDDDLIAWNAPQFGVMFADIFAAPTARGSERRHGQ